MRDQFQVQLCVVSDAATLVQEEEKVLTVLKENIRSKISLLQHINKLTAN